MKKLMLALAACFVVASAYAGPVVVKTVSGTYGVTNVKAVVAPSFGFSRTIVLSNGSYYSYAQPTIVQAPVYVVPTAAPVYTAPAVVAPAPAVVAPAPAVVAPAPAVVAPAPAPAPAVVAPAPAVAPVAAPVAAAVTYTAPTVVTAPVFIQSAPVAYSVITPYNTFAFKTPIVYNASFTGNKVFAVTRTTGTYVK